MSKTYQPELGQAVFGQPHKAYKVPNYLEASLGLIREELARVTWNVTQRDDLGDPFGNEATQRDLGVFQVESYSWDDDLEQEYNFKYRDLEISWYKYFGRGMSMNRKFTPDQTAIMLDDCLTAIKNRDVDLMKQSRLHEEMEPEGIDLAKLESSDELRAVVYIDSGKTKLERGFITSWNDKFIFVRYHSGDTSAATSPSDLTFVDSL